MVSATMRSKIEVDDYFPVKDQERLLGWGTFRLRSERSEAETSL